MALFGYSAKNGGILDYECLQQHTTGSNSESVPLPTQRVAIYTSHIPVSSSCRLQESRNSCRDQNECTRLSSMILVISVIAALNTSRCVSGEASRNLTLSPIFADNTHKRETLRMNVVYGCMSSTARCQPSRFSTEQGQQRMRRIQVYIYLRPYLDNLNS